MVEAVDRLGPWLLDLGIGAAAWLSLAMLAIVSCRQPIFRRDLARVGIVGALILPAMTLLPIARYELLGPSSAGFGREPPMLGGPSGTATAIGGPGRMLTVAYLIIALAGVGWTLVGAWALRHLIRSAAEPSDRSAALFAELPFDGRPGRRPGLCVSGRIGRPVLIGGFRPMIVVPADWDRPDPESADRLRLGLLHELAHAERRDPMFHWLGGLALAFWFALPPIWWIRRQLRIDQELLADERAARRLGADARSYAASLVDMAADRPVGDRPVGVGAAATRGGIDPDGSPLVRRVAMLVRSPFPIEPIGPFWWRLGLSPTAAVALLLISRLSLAGAGGGAETDRPEPAPMAFHLRELAVASWQDGSPIRLPAPLPERFALSLLVFADPSTLGGLAIADCRLGLPADAGSMDDDPGLEAWHRVRIESDRGTTRLWINDRPERATREPGSCGSWLTIRPAPGRSVLIRDLILAPACSGADGPDPR